MSDNSRMASQLRRWWESACRDKPERQSIRVEDGRFVLTLKGRREGWVEAVRANGVPGDAHQVVDDAAGTLTLSWPSHADAIFGPGGMMAAALPNYEPRLPQLYMARLVQRAIEMRDVAAIEAGTGTGKSFAYAAICMAMGKQVVISTSNKALQSQLYTKDIPFLLTLFPGRTVVQALGKSNYVCVENVEGEHAEPVDDKRFREWYGETETGSLEEISLAPDLRDKVAVDDDCTGKDCPLYAYCFYYKARQARFDADVVICNHALLAQHAAVGWLLPEWDVLVVDEAHNIVGYMREALGNEINVGSLKRTVALAKPYVASETIQFAEALVDAGKDEVTSGYEWDKQPQVDVPEGKRFLASERLRAEMLNLADMVAGSTTTIARWKRIKGKRAERIENAAEKLGGFLTDDAGNVRWAEKRGDQVLLCAKPVDVSQEMFMLSARADDTRYLQRVPVIYCSATLATPDMGPFLATIGAEDAFQMVVKSPFDYRRNAMIYVSDGADPKPSDKDIGHYLSQQILALVTASKGGALILFTSTRQMRAMHALLSYEIKKRLKLNVMVQGGNMPNAELVRHFKTDGNAVLFATRSFFEGVDIGGAALRLVVLDKLPFEAPNPMSKARRALAGGSIWEQMERVDVPDMLITLKQAAGRLIRTNTDKGVIAVLDSRIRSKWRGRVFGSLPDAPNTSNLADVAEFFQPVRKPTATQAAMFEHEPARVAYR